MVVDMEVAVRMEGVVEMERAVDMEWVVQQCVRRLMSPTSQINVPRSRWMKLGHYSLLEEYLLLLVNPTPHQRERSRILAILELRLPLAPL